jgi:hypothetical protein
MNLSQRHPGGASSPTEHGSHPGPVADLRPHLVPRDSLLVPQVTHGPLLYPLDRDRPREPARIRDKVPPLVPRRRKAPGARHRPGGKRADGRGVQDHEIFVSIREVLRAANAGRGAGRPVHDFLTDRSDSVDVTSESPPRRESVSGVRSIQQRLSRNPVTPTIVSFCSRTSVALESGRHRIESAIVQPSTKHPAALPAVADHYGGLAATQLPAQAAGRSAEAPWAGLRKRVLRQVVVLEVAGRLSDIVQDLNLALEQALSEVPRGVICDLSGVFEGAEPGGVDGLAVAGRHVREWPWIPVAVACPDPVVRAALAAHPLGRKLIVTSSMFSALSAVLATPTLDVQWLRLAPHPTAPRASRSFVTRTLLDWQLGRVIHAASLVVSELVTGSMMHAGTEIDLSMAWHLGALRLTVRDHGPDVPRQPYSRVDPCGRSLSLIPGLFDSLGSLSTADGGTVVWAVLDAARSISTDQPTSSQSCLRNLGVTQVDRRPSTWAKRTRGATSPPEPIGSPCSSHSLEAFASPN